MSLVGTVLPAALAVAMLLASMPAEAGPADVGPGSPTAPGEDVSTDTGENTQLLSPTTAWLLASADKAADDEDVSQADNGQPTGRSRARLPKWELGIGGVVYTQPDYLGSDEYRLWTIPFPWIIYRGEVLRLSRDALQARLFRTDRVRIDLSASGRVPVNSSQNNRRRGMRDLSWVAELGPTLRILLDRSADGSRRLDIDIPVRAAVAVDTDRVSYEGIIVDPKLRYRQRLYDWGFDAQLGLEFADREYEEYIYGVDPKWATAERPAYRADGGYRGVRLATGAGRYFGSVYVGLFARYYNMMGAAHEDSPLVATDHAFVGGLALGWVWQSSEEAAGASTPNGIED
jgi:outer membrane protein